MAYDATKPAVADNYSTGYTQNIRDNFDAVLKMLEGISVTGTVPTGAKRYNATNDLFEYYTGSAWAEMPLNYLKKSGDQTVSGTITFTGVNVGANAVWHAGNFTPSSKANNDAPSMTGNGTIAGTFQASRLFGGGTQTGNNGIGKVTLQTSTTLPSGSAGDICVIYTA